MGPVTETPFDIRRVAVIGAGPCGLAAAKYLSAERHFTTITIFDQRASPGGVWNYTSLNVVDADFTVPRIRPSSHPDTAISSPDGSPGVQFVSPVYDLLETNIPHTLMQYGDTPFPSDAALFPPHWVVKGYLDGYAEDVKEMLRLQTQVRDVRRKAEGEGWEVEALDLRTGKTEVREYDAVVVASGHYNDSYIPDIPGLKEWHERWPGSVSHSKFYRRPGEYAGKKVIVVGNSASGIDLSMQISSVAALPVMISEKAKPTVTPTSSSPEPWALSKPEITSLDPSTRTATFSDGTTESEIDAIVFCTGYFYAFPFLSSSKPPIQTLDGACARHLWEHLLYIPHPTLAFLGLPQRVVPFPLSEGQAAVISRFWSGRLHLPSPAQMAEWEADLISEKRDGQAVHNLAFPRDVEYINRMHGIAMGAERWEGLEGDGNGKEPPYWDEEKSWMRERFPMIKAKARALGEGRHNVRSLGELGFDFEKWKREEERAEKEAGRAA